MSNDDYSVVGWLFWPVIFGVMFFWNDIWDSKWRNAIYFGVSQDQITIDKKLHDCEFLSAPLGSKHCHYDKVVQTVTWTLSTKGKPIISYDGGKSWQPFDPAPGVKVPTNPKVQSAYISWNKVTE
jgi:hypothetical protein